MESNDWEFVEPTPKAPSMSSVVAPILPRQPPQPFVTVQHISKSKSKPEMLHSLPMSLQMKSPMGDHHLPIPLPKSIVPTSLMQDQPIPSPSISAGLATPKSQNAVAPPTPTFQVGPTKHSQPEPQKPKPRTKSRRADLLRVRQPSSNPVLVQMFVVSLLSMLGEASQVFLDLHSSPHFEEHAGRLLDKFAASTVLKYCPTSMRFFTLLSSLGYLMETLTVADLADILLTSSLSRSSDPGASGGRALIKALRWLSKIATVDFLQTLMYHQVINAFVVAKQVRDQQETAPFSLWVVMQFERRILQRSTPAWEAAFLGAVLTCTYGGLRFADSQRLPFRSFVLDKGTFRGVCDRTKTSHKGQPFGLLTCGLLSKGQFTWVSKYLETLDDIWAQSELESICSSR